MVSVVPGIVSGKQKKQNIRNQLVIYKKTLWILWTLLYI